jgi:NTP pyrophosphatase (non-canonical NTP hydrolase)
MKRLIERKVIEWANERGLIKQENAPKQFIKLTEEVGELASALLKGDPYETIDAIGDIQVVLIILCEQLNINYSEALESAYNEIKERKGKTVNGTFIKE